MGFGPTQAGESFAQLRRAVVAPQGEARSDTWIVCELARRLGLGKQLLRRQRGRRPSLRARALGGHARAAARAAGRGAGAGRGALQALHRAGPGRPLGGLRHPEPPRGDLLGPARGARAEPPARLRRAGREPGEPAGPGRALPAPSSPPPRSCSSATASTGACRGCDGTARSPWPSCIRMPRRRAPSAPTTGWWSRRRTAPCARGRGSTAASIPEVVCAQFGWWQACPPLGLPGYDADGPGSANYNRLIDPDAADPISGTVALRSYLCEVRRGDP